MTEFVQITSMDISRMYQFVTAFKRQIQSNWICPNFKHGNFKNVQICHNLKNTNLEYCDGTKHPSSLFMGRDGTSGALPFYVKRCSRFSPIPYHNLLSRFNVILLECSNWEPSSSHLIAKWNTPWIVHIGQQQTSVRSLDYFLRTSQLVMVIPRSEEKPTICKNKYWSQANKWSSTKPTQPTNNESDKSKVFPLVALLDSQFK